LVDGVKARIAKIQMLQNCELIIQVELLVQVRDQFVKIALHCPPPCIPVRAGTPFPHRYWRLDRPSTADQLENHRDDR
jgi:hypothetical protein